MAWKYRFDDGPETELPIASTLYIVAAMAAFGREDIRLLPTIKQGVTPYEGHTVTLWDDDLIRHGYQPSMYGLAYNECGTLTLPFLAKINH